MENYPSNSYKSKTEGQKETKKVQAVVSSPVKTKKKSEARKLADTFISEDVHNVKEYIIMDVLIPAAKKAISDIVTNGIDMILYGETRNNRSSSPASKVSYRSYYASNDRDRDRRDVNSRVRKTYEYDDIIIPNRGDAEAVLMGMDDLMKEYKVVSVADFYELVGVTGTYTDNNYGWTDISSAHVARVRDGYVIKLPRALAID